MNAATRKDCSEHMGFRFLCRHQDFTLVTLIVRLDTLAEAIRPYCRLKQFVSQRVTFKIAQ